MTQPKPIFDRVPGPNDVQGWEGLVAERLDVVVLALETLAADIKATMQPKATHADRRRRLNMAMCFVTGAHTLMQLAYAADLAIEEQQRQQKDQ